jgi:hypothetical protein
MKYIKKFENIDFNDIVDEEFNDIEIQKNSIIFIHDENELFDILNKINNKGYRWVTGVQIQINNIINDIINDIINYVKEYEYVYLVLNNYDNNNILQYGYTNDLDDIYKHNSKKFINL